MSANIASSVVSAAKTALHSFAGGGTTPDELGGLTKQEMLDDIDAILARLETGIAAELAAMRALRERLTEKAT